MLTPVMGAVQRILLFLSCVMFLMPSTEAVHNCSIYGDPHLLTYKGARGTILIPCRFRATHFVIKIPGQDKWCETNIFAFGRVHGGGVYTGGADLRISIFGYQGTVQTSIGSIEFVITDYFLQGSLPNFTWGQSLNVTMDVVTVSWTFNPDGAILNVPACGFSLVYRLRTARPSGIVISVSDNATISPGYQQYVFCGDLNDTSHTLIDDARRLGVDLLQEGLAYRTLIYTETQNLVIPSLTPTLHKSFPVCEFASFMITYQCTDSNRVRALQFCLGFFRKRHLLKCLSDPGETIPMEAFYKCGNQVCQPSATVCSEFKRYAGNCTEHLTPRLRRMYESPNCLAPTL